jgi:hypothetical protein
MMFEPWSNKKGANRSVEKRQVPHNTRARAILKLWRALNDRVFAQSLPLCNNPHACASNNRYLLATAR